MAQAQNNRRSDEKRFVDVSTEPDKILPSLPNSSECESIPTLLDAVKSSEHLVEDLRKNAEKALSKCKNPKDKLSQDESAALYLYSMQWPVGKHSFYFLFNRVLRNEDRTKLIPYHGYFILFMSALNKLPSREQQVWRGVVGDLTSQYLTGTTHVWWGASSCTDQIHVTGTFLDQNQKRTLFNIKCYEGKIIKDHSAFPNENEIILPPGTYLTVKSALLLHADAYIVELEQVPPDPKLIVETTSVASGMPEKKDNISYLIWSDPTVNKSSDNKKTQEKLRDIFDNNFKTFESGDQCENFTKQNKNYRLVLIVNGQIGCDLLPKIHNLSQVISVYVYCMDKEGNEKWTKNYNKVKAVVVRSTDLISEIEKDKEKENKKSQHQFSGNSQSNNVLYSFECPFRGFENEPLQTLRKALEPVYSFIPDLDQLVYLATQCSSGHNEHGLTKDESAAICIYTMEGKEHEYSLYELLNKALRSTDRHSCKKWFPYLKLFMTALHKLPPLKCTVWRTVQVDVSEQYPKGMEGVWWGVSSASLKTLVLGDMFLDTHGTRTFFSIECENGKNISSYSYFETEAEAILLPGFYFRVRNVLQPAPDLHIIHLEEIKPPSLLVS